MINYSFLNEMQVGDYVELKGFTNPQCNYMKKKAKNNGWQINIARGLDGQKRAIRTA